MTIGASGCKRLLDRPDDVELLVVDDDALDGRRSRGLVFCGHCGDGLARKPDSVDRHHRPVADGVTPVGIEVGEVGCRQDAHDARHRLRVARVDGRDPRMGVGRAQDFPVQHAWHDDVAGELRLATQLLGRVAARSRLPDRRPPAICTGPVDAWAHAVTRRRSQTASRIPR